ncbi:MAG: hypothetical protein SPI72_04370 [Porphyromonas sp.]|nr:hypothetical protein [Porphyromonas sp.]
MKKRFLSVVGAAALVAGLLVSAPGCSKDYEGDISDLKQKVDKNSQTIASLQEAVNKIMKEGKIISSVKAEGMNLTFTFLDGSSMTVTLTQNPSTLIIKDGFFWIDGQKTDIPAPLNGKDGKDGLPGASPKIIKGKGTYDKATQMGSEDTANDYWWVVEYTRAEDGTLVENYKCLDVPARGVNGDQGIHGSSVVLIKGKGTYNETTKMGSEDTEHTYWWTVTYSDAEGKVVKERKCTDVRADYVTVEIGENGNWWIDGKDSGKSATPGKVMIQQDPAGFSVITITQPGETQGQTFVLPATSSELKGLFFRSTFNYRGFQAMNLGYDLIKPIKVSGTPSVKDNGEKYVDESKWIRQGGDSYELIYDLNPSGFDAKQYIKTMENLEFEVKTNKELSHRALVDASQTELTIKSVDFSEAGKLKITVDPFAPEALGGVDKDGNAVTTMARLKAKTTNADKFGNKQVLSDWATVYNDICNNKFGIFLNNYGNVLQLPYAYEDEDGNLQNVEHKIFYDEDPVDLKQLLVLKSLRLDKNNEPLSVPEKWEDRSEFMKTHGLKFEYYLMHGEDGMTPINIDGNAAKKYDIITIDEDGMLKAGTDKVRPNLAVNCSQAVQVRVVDSNGVVVSLGFIRIRVVALEDVECIEETWKKPFTFHMNGTNSSATVFSGEIKKAAVEALRATYDGNKYDYGVVEALLENNYDLKNIKIDFDNIPGLEAKMGSQGIDITRTGDCLVAGDYTFKFIIGHHPEVGDIEVDLPTEDGWFPALPQCVTFEVPIKVDEPKEAINTGIAEAPKQKVTTYWVTLNPLTGEVHTDIDIVLATVQRLDGVGAVGVARVAQAFKPNFRKAILDKIGAENFQGDVKFAVNTEKVMAGGKKFSELHPNVRVGGSSDEDFVIVDESIGDEGLTVPMQLVLKVKNCETRFVIMEFDVVMRNPAKLVDQEIEFTPNPLMPANPTAAELQFDVVDTENNNNPIYEAGRVVSLDRAKYLFGSPYSFGQNAEMEFGVDETMSQELKDAAQAMIDAGSIKSKLEKTGGIIFPSIGKVVVTYKPGTTPLHLTEPVTFVAKVKVTYGKTFVTKATYKFTLKPRA